MTDDQFAEVERHLTMTVGTADDALELMTRVAALAVRFVPGADRASIIVSFDPLAPFTVGATDAAAEAVDREQYAANDGPCLRASRTGVAVDLSVDTVGRWWPEVAVSARTSGIGRIAAFPVHVDGTPGRTVGSLNLYSDAGTGHAVDPSGDVLAVLMQYLAASLQTVDRHTSTHGAVRTLQTAMDARQAIDTAAGVFMVREGLTLAQAVAALTAYAREHDLTVHDAAHEVLNSLA